MLMPRQPVPELRVPTLAHGDYLLTSEAPANFNLLVFYRGLHCPICLKYLLELARLQSEFDKRGVKVIAISSDGHERARRWRTSCSHPTCASASTLRSRRRVRGGCISAPREDRPRSASTSQPCSPSRASSSCDLTERCTTAPCRPCRSPGRTSTSCWQPSTSPWRRTTPHAANTPARCDAGSARHLV